MGSDSDYRANHSAVTWPMDKAYILWKFDGNGQFLPVTLWIEERAVPSKDTHTSSRHLPTQSLVLDIKTPGYKMILGPWNYCVSRRYNSLWLVFGICKIPVFNPKPSYQGSINNSIVDLNIPFTHSTRHPNIQLGQPTLSQKQAMLRTTPHPETHQRTGKMTATGHCTRIAYLLLSHQLPYHQVQTPTSQRMGHTYNY